MATHRISRDTCNVSLNLPLTERAVLGQLATTRDMSLGQLLRGLYLARLRNEAPAVASQIVAARTARRARRLKAATATTQEVKA